MSKNISAERFYLPISGESIRPRIFQFRNTSDLEVIWQLPIVFESLNQIDGYAGLILAGVNDNLLQLWKINAPAPLKEFLRHRMEDYSLPLPGRKKSICVMDIECRSNKVLHKK